VSTISDIVTSSRELLQDGTVPYRYDDARLVRTYNSALREAFRIRPDLFLGVSYVLPTYSDADLAVDLIVEEQYYNAIVAFIVGWTEMSDDEFALDQRAAALLTAFRNQLVGSSILPGAVG